MAKDIENIEELFKTDACEYIKNNSQRLEKFIELDKKSLELDIKSGALSKKKTLREKEQNQKICIGI